VPGPNLLRVFTNIRDPMADLGHRDAMTAGSATPAIDIRGLHVVRGGRPVLEDLTVTVPAGRITGLLGPSGCGKSTLMRTIVGTQRVAGGETVVLGRPAGAPALRAEIGYVTQAPAIYTDLTAHENLTHFARILGAPLDRAARVIGALRLGDASDRRVDALSGGQRSRVSLGVALLGAPRLLVLDEPTVGLDPVVRNELWEDFRRLRDDGVTLIVSSHVMDDAAECDGLLLMRAGRIIRDCTPDELLRETGAENLSDAFLRVVEREDPAS